MTHHKWLNIVRDGETHHFVAEVEETDTGASGRVIGVAGCFAAAEDVARCLRLLQGALIFHWDGLAADGIDLFENDPEIGD
jgi:hypothetical protein